MKWKNIINFFGIASQEDMQNVYFDLESLDDSYYELDKTVSENADLFQDKFTSTANALKILHSKIEDLEELVLKLDSLRDKDSGYKDDDIIRLSKRLNDLENKGKKNTTVKNKTKSKSSQ